MSEPTQAPGSMDGLNGANGALALELKGVVKRYGAKTALVGLDLKVPRGSIFGLVGANGAGKTTTFSIISGFLSSDEGTVDLLGEGPFEASRHRGRVTILPQDSALGRDMPVAEQLFYFARLQGLSRKEARESVSHILKVVDLESRARERVRMLSHGMMRRMGIAQCFLGSPELVLLDEPTNGLDPRQANQIRAFIAAGRGARTVVVSSHNLNEIEHLCDHIALIDQGRVVRSGTVAEITGRQGEIRIGLGEGPASASGLVQVLQQGLPRQLTLGSGAPSGASGLEDNRSLALASAVMLQGALQVQWHLETRTMVIRFSPQEGAEAEDIINAALTLLLQNGARIASVSRGQSLERTFLESTHTS